MPDALLFVGGDLSAAGSRIDNNSGGEGGGAYVVGAIALVNTTITANRVDGFRARGGGVAQSATSTRAVDILRAQFSNNSATGSNVAIFFSDGTNVATATGGGLAAAGVVSLVDTSFSGNVSQGGRRGARMSGFVSFSLLRQ